MSEEGQARSSPRELEFQVPAVLAGERVDKTVSMIAGVSRRVAEELIASGKVEVDGRIVSVRSRALAAGQHLRVQVEAAQNAMPVADPSVGFDVVYEDDSIVVVDKPPGLVVHAGAGSTTGTLVSGLLARYPDLAELPRSGWGDVQRPGIVHRLDKGTSGLLVVARTVDAFESLTRQFREHSAARRYYALVAGLLESDRGVVEAPIGRSTRRPDRMAVSSSGRQARTSYSVITRYGAPVAATLLEAVLDTGRTHQVRVHLAAIGHPVIGDDRYSVSASRPAELRRILRSGRYFLHAHELEIEHPAGGRRTWSSALPSDLQEVLNSLTSV